MKGIQTTWRKKESKSQNLDAGSSRVGFEWFELCLAEDCFFCVIGPWHGRDGRILPDLSLVSRDSLACKMS